jgi:hypothetical protein
MDTARQCPSLKEFIHHAKPRPAAYAVYYISAALFAWVIFIMGAFFHGVILSFELSSGDEDSTRTFGNLAGFFLVFPIITIVIKLNRFRRRWAVDPPKALDGSRPPVLFLRSFDDDKFRNKARLDMRSYEEHLVYWFSRVGPVIAVGRPSENLPIPGALRLYFNDFEWKEKVEQLMSLSQFVILQAGSTTGLEWEIATAIQKVDRGKVLISFIHWQELGSKKAAVQYEAFRKRNNWIFNHSLPNTIGDAFYLYLDDNGEPAFASLDKIGIYWFKFKRLLRTGPINALIGFRIIDPLSLTMILDALTADMYEAIKSEPYKLSFLTTRHYSVTMYFVLFMIVSALFALFILAIHGIKLELTL